MNATTIILHDQNGNRSGRGRYAFGAYSPIGRLYYGIRTSLPFLLISMLLLLIPGESFFYGLFFFIFVPYQMIVLLRMKQISFHVDGACPACAALIRFPLEPGEHLPVWKYCPYCDTSFRLCDSLT